MQQLEHTCFLRASDDDGYIAMQKDLKRQLRDSSPAIQHGRECNPLFLETKWDIGFSCNKLELRVLDVTDLQSVYVINRRSDWLSPNNDVRYRITSANSSPVPVMSDLIVDEILREIGALRLGHSPILIRYRNAEGQLRFALGTQFENPVKNSKLITISSQLHRQGLHKRYINLNLVGKFQLLNELATAFTQSKCWNHYLLMMTLDNIFANPRRTIYTTGFYKRASGQIVLMPISDNDEAFVERRHDLGQVFNWSWLASNPELIHVSLVEMLLDIDLLKLCSPYLQDDALEDFVMTIERRALYLHNKLKGRARR